jgi:hypothetical protein
MALWWNSRPFAYLVTLIPKNNFTGTRLYSCSPSSLGGWMCQAVLRKGQRRQQFNLKYVFANNQKLEQ